MKLYQIDLVHNDSIETISGVFEHEFTENYLFVSKSDQLQVINLSKVIKVVIYRKES